MKQFIFLRYIVCEFLTPTTRGHVVLPFKDKDLAHSIKISVEKLHGDYGAAMVNQSLRGKCTVKFKLYFKTLYNINYR